MWIDTLMFRHSSNLGIFCRSERKECLSRHCGYRLFKLKHYFPFFEWFLSCHMNPKRQRTFFDQDKNMYQSKWGGVYCCGKWTYGDLRRNEGSLRDLFLHGSQQQCGDLGSITAKKISEDLNELWWRSVPRSQRTSLSVKL